MSPYFTEKRLTNILASLSMNPGKDLTQNLTKCLRSIHKCCQVLETVRPTHASMASALTRFLEDHRKTVMDLMKTKLLCNQFMQRNSDATIFKNQLERYICLLNKLLYKL